MFVVLIPTLLFSQGTLQVRDVSNSISINSGDITPSLTDGTDFGNTNLGSSKANTFTFDNIAGNGPTSLSSVSINISGANATEFTLSTSNLGNGNLNRNTNKYLTITFTPSSAGLKTATVTVSFTNGTNSPYIFTIQGNGILSYCTPININNYNINFISNVSLGAINNTTNGNTGAYNNYTSFATIDANAGMNLNGNISINLNGWNQVTSNKINIWIDFNQDLDFEDAGENFIINVNSGASVSGTKTIVVPISILIPATAALGNTRIRIGFIDDIQTASYSACNFSYNTGEIEDYTINIAGCSTNMWTGTTDYDWNKPSNWSCGTVPTISTNVLIPSPLTSGKYPIIYNGTPFGKVNNIEIQNNSTASLQIRDNYIQIAGTLLLNGKLDLQGEAQLIQNTGSTIDIASTGFIEIDQQGQGNRYRYNDWSSPVIKTGTTAGTPYTVADVLRDGTDPDNPKTIDFVGGYDGSIPGGSGAIKIANSWIYKYTNSPDGNYNGWGQIGSTGNLNPGEGFLMKGPGNPGSSDQNYVFVGKPNNGTINLAISGNNDYLVGNPYPSALDANQFILDNASSLRDGTIYFWEHYGGNSHNLADYQAGYAYYNLSGGVVASAHSVVNQSVPNGTKQPQRYIAIGQGFFVWADADGGSIQFNNNQRMFATETSGSSIFMKGAAQKNSIKSKIASDDERPKFRLGFKGEKIDNRQILLTIDENSTDGVDYGYEAEIYEIFEDDMFWTIADKKYVIQATNTIDINKEIPIGIISSGGLISIKMDALENVSDTQEIYIKDKITGGIHTIKNQSFEIDLPKGEYLNRFALTFKSENTLAVEEETLEDDILVFMNNSNKALQIVKPINLEIEAIILYNNLGQIKGYWKEEFLEDSFSLPVKAATGIYFVQINTKNGKIGKKILIE
ncbi:GEVED domain-containing protein [Lutibacter maritimus]|uniref:Por secretion system C-terminal sorting domain-containing protein n=1 Tax=Lutibacter maritimus TaxID=593133 RepID=A0A1I6PMS3_9FLAO|nr:GEVED domain-containing protein [Lutibacter maritimus]SFS41430.1 Por secretion system C-terminal sorting domain-containing protein [Lutibacter maritimus]